ncbi:hypothetical protein R3W88_006176 [Solanum pinnatisectum]|uniref:Uncharacterized protein n=1 Tax=Solanum pinnatisectum TaxID=50273 RepID=A0AAV9KEY0_9SOLN|nr:hypothetical protein R3W88_006176 [Solanum pinnatisectum]
MTSPSENHSLAIIPHEYPKSTFILPDVMLVDFFSVTHLAYPLMVDALIKGEEHSQRFNSHCEGELKLSKEQVYTTHSDDDNTSLVKMIPEQLRSQISKVTRAAQCDLDAALLTRSTKESHGMKSKFIPPENSIDIRDDVVKPKKDKKRKRSASMGSFMKQENVSKLVKKSSHTDDYVDDVVVLAELLILLQAQGWNALFLQGNRRRKMGKKETREFYINAVGSTSSITSKSVIPTTSRGANAHVQHLNPLLTTKNEEIAAFRVTHSAVMDQLHLSYGFEHAGLLKLMEIKRSSNSAHLKNLVDLFAKSSPSSSFCGPPSV